MTPVDLSAASRTCTASFGGGETQAVILCPPWSKTTFHFGTFHFSALQGADSDVSSGKFHIRYTFPTRHVSRTASGVIIRWSLQAHAEKCMTLLSCCVCVWVFLQAKPTTSRMPHSSSQGTFGAGARLLQNYPQVGIFLALWGGFILGCFLMLILLRRSRLALARAMSGN